METDCPICPAHYPQPFFNFPFPIENIPVWYLDSVLNQDLKKFLVSSPCVEILKEISALNVKLIPFHELDLNKAKKLGEGGFGFVYSGKWRLEEVAIKFLNLKVQ